MQAKFKKELSITRQAQSPKKQEPKVLEPVKKNLPVENNIEDYNKYVNDYIGNVTARLDSIKTYIASTKANLSMNSNEWADNPYLTKGTDKIIPNVRSLVNKLQEDMNKSDFVKK